MNNLRQISVILYRLKRNYGKPVTLRKITANNIDLTTGEVTRPHRTVNIKRGTVLPVRQIPDFVYDLSSRNFAYGGVFNSSTRLVIIDGRDIPKDYELSLGDEIIFDEKVHALKEFIKTPDGRGYLIQATVAGSINE